MAVRLTTKLFINALMRRATSLGGHVTVLAHGDDSAGGLLLICLEKGQLSAVLERSTDAQGRMVWHACFSQLIENKDKLLESLQKRAAQDSDLWQVELDIADAERFAADFIAEG